MKREAEVKTTFFKYGAWMLSAAVLCSACLGGGSIASAAEYGERTEDLRVEEAWLLVKLDRAVEACDVLKPVLESGDLSDNTLDAAAAAFGAAGRWKEARQWVEKRFEKNPNDMRLLKSLGEIRYQSGDAAAAAEAFERLHGLGGGTVATYHLLGDAYRSAGKKSESDRAYEKALELLRGGKTME
jgi:tetratricopeptide (TPR) repeat protein